MNQKCMNPETREGRQQSGILHDKNLLSNVCQETGDTSLKQLLSCGHAELLFQTHKVHPHLRVRLQV